jgi:hypothetical protein
MTLAELPVTFRQNLRLQGIDSQIAERNNPTKLIV